MDRYLTAQEAADEYGWTEQWVRKLCATGRLPATKRGNQWFINRRDLDRFQKLPKGVPGRPRKLGR